MTNHNCLHCSAPIDHTKANRARRAYCGKTCRRLASYARFIKSDAYKAQLANQKASYVPVAYEVTCGHCANTFTAKIKTKRFCSASCQVRGNMRRCSQPGCDKPHRAKGLCGPHYCDAFLPDRTKRWPAKPENRRRALQNQNARRRVRLAAVKVESVDRNKVGERDQWRCGICRKTVDIQFAWPDPMSPSLDHIVPLSQGGDHTYANARISHLRCNVKRSNRGGGEQLALFG
jgi:hypothetical protein